MPSRIRRHHPRNEGPRKTPSRAGRHLVSGAYRELESEHQVSATQQLNAAAPRLARGPLLPRCCSANSPNLPVMSSATSRFFASGSSASVRVAPSRPPGPRARSHWQALTLAESGKAGTGAGRGTPDPHHDPHPGVSRRTNRGRGWGRGRAPGDARSGVIIVAGSGLRPGDDSRGLAWPELGPEVPSAGPRSSLVPFGAQGMPYYSL